MSGLPGITGVGGSRLAARASQSVHGEVCEFSAACSRTFASNTALQAGVRLALLARMQAMMRSTWGMSELQSRYTSGAQVARSLSLTTRACPWVGYNITEIATRQTIRPILHLVFMTLSPLWRFRKQRFSAVFSDACASRLPP
jgi:hypothetical protein